MSPLKYVLCLFWLILTGPFSQAQENYVLLVSFDGFRHDYVEKYQLSHFQAFIRKGTAAEALIPSFPSKTFPNHYTLVTGLYPGHHGLVDNSFFDPDRSERFSIRDRSRVEDAYYYGGLPLWQLAQREGLKTASFFWVGSEAPVGGTWPTYYKVYDGSVPNEARIDTVMQWFQWPADRRPVLASLYFSLVDSEGHRSGPNSRALAETVREADRLLGRILAGVDTLDIPVNVILTSDHGMYELDETPGTVIVLEDLLEPVADRVRAVNSGALVHLYLQDKQAAREVYRSLKKRMDGCRVYLTRRTPKRWHYRDHPRAGDLLVVAEPGHYILDRKAARERANRTGTWGVHGYDPYGLPEMGGIFYARGPAIRQGFRIKAFENVHVYPLVAELLGLPLPPVDGKLSVLKPILR